MVGLFSCFFIKTSEDKTPYVQSAPDSSNNLPTRLNVDKIPSNPPQSSFPPDVLRWMKKNASPRQTFMLMNVNKYFFQRSLSLWAIKRVYAFCERIELITINRRIRGSYLKDIPNNLWITTTFEYSIPSFTSFISKVVYCDLKDLSLFNQYLSLKDFKFLTTSGNLKKIYLAATVITKSNNYFVSLEDIFECIKNVRTIFFNDVVHSFNSTKIPTEFINLKVFKLWNFPESFNFKALSKFMRQNKNVKFDIVVLESFSLKRTKELQYEVDKVVKSWSPKFPVPHIKFPGQSEVSKFNLFKLSHADSHVK